MMCTTPAVLLSRPLKKYRDARRDRGVITGISLDPSQTLTCHCWLQITCHSLTTGHAQSWLMPLCSRIF